MKEVSLCASVFINSFLHLNFFTRYSHAEKDHLVRLLKQLMLMASPPLQRMTGRTTPSAADVPTLLGTGSFSLFSCIKCFGLVSFV